jgi:hypothetical protein
MVAGNDVVRSSAAPTLEVYGDPSHGGNEPRLELVSNTSNTVSTTFTRLTSNAGVFTIQSGTVGTADSKGDIAFSSIDGTTEHMRIQGSTGNVGIGTTNPGNSLHIYKNANERTSGLFIEKAQGGTNAAALFFGVMNDTGENPGVAKAAIFYERNLVNGRGDLKFCNNAVSDATAVTPADADTRMTIKNNGKVGISNPNPYHTLDVSGNFRATEWIGLGGGANARPIQLTKTATIINNYPYVDFFFTNLAGGWNPFLIEVLGYAINVSGTTVETLRRYTAAYGIEYNDTINYMAGPVTRIDDTNISVVYTVSTRRVRCQLNDLRSYSGIYATVTSFAGVI